MFIDPISWSFEGPYFLIALCIGYLIGSVPYGLLLTRFAGKGDLRTIGSGNIGATNVLRTGSKFLAAVTLLADLLKGTLAVYLGWYFGGETIALFAGFGAFLGHLFPIWLKFRGGKGVATYIGILLGLSWLAALVFALCWLIVAMAFRFSSLASIVSACLVPIYLYFSGELYLLQLVVPMTVLTLLKHSGNICRLLDGTESRIGQTG